MKKRTDSILIYPIKHFKINNSKLLYIKTGYQHNSNGIKIETSIVIVLHNLN